MLTVVIGAGITRYIGDLCALKYNVLVVKESVSLLVGFQMREGASYPLLEDLYLGTVLLTKDNNRHELRGFISLCVN